MNLESYSFRLKGDFVFLGIIYPHNNRKIYQFKNNNNLIRWAELMSNLFKIK